MDTATPLLPVQSQLFSAADLAPPPVRQFGPQDPRNPYRHAWPEAEYRRGEG